MRGGGSVNKPGAFIYSNPRAKRWNFAEGVWLNGYWTHDWDNHSVKAASYGAENGTNDVIRLAATIPYGVMGRTWGRKERRFYVSWTRRASGISTARARCFTSARRKGD